MTACLAQSLTDRQAAPDRPEHRSMKLCDAGSIQFSRFSSEWKVR
jgi:hypothetical protein